MTVHVITALVHGGCYFLIITSVIIFARAVHKEEQRKAAAGEK